VRDAKRIKALEEKMYQLARDLEFEAAHRCVTRLPSCASVDYSLMACGEGGATVLSA
jgi:excinuclease UvrABC nuclease subunit